MAHREVCVALDDCSWHFPSCFAHHGFAFRCALSPSSRVLRRALPILVDQRFAVRFARLSHLASPFDHPLAFAFSFSVLPSALPIIESFSAGFLFCVITNDTHGDRLRQDSDRKCMDLSGFIFIIIVNDMHLDKLRQDFYMKCIDSNFNLELLFVRHRAPVSIFCAVACGMIVVSFWIG